MVNTIYLLSFVETPRKFIIAELSIRKLGSSSVLIMCIKIALLNGHLQFRNKCGAPASRVPPAGEVEKGN